MANLFATKSLDTILGEAAETGEHTLKRSLGATNLVTLYRTLGGDSTLDVTAAGPKPVQP